MAKRLLIGNERDRQKAAALIRAGGLVVFPTDTVYGIGGDLRSSAAIAAIYAAKERPRGKGLPVLLADAADVWQVATHLSPLAHSLCQAYWPGPLTIIVPKRPELPANLTPNDGVAVRVPDHPETQALIRLVGGAVASSSANIAAAPPATNAAAAIAALGEKVAAVLDGGEAGYQLASTIVDCRRDRPVLVRQGPLQLQLDELADCK